MTPYADSSFLVALYIPGPHAPLALWRALGETPLPFNPLHRLEVRNAIRRRAGDHNLAVNLLGELDADVGQDLLHQPLPWTEVLRRAEDIGRQHTEQTRLRAYDLFHVAAAVATGHDTLLTFDRRQAATARLVGLDVYGV